MSQVLCSSTGPGLRNSEVVANVTDMNGRIHSIRVEKDFLTYKDGGTYLPIGIVQFASASGAVLIEFSHEPETGKNRIWVNEDQLDVKIKECAA